MLVTVKGDAFGELEISWGLYSDVWLGKPWVSMTSDQASLYVVPRLGRYASPLYWLIILEPLIVPLSGVNSYVVVLSSYIKMMKRRTLQICSLKHSIKKGILFCLSRAGGSPTNTHQRVVLNSQSSKWSPMKAWGPQESVLDPLYFLWILFQS